MRIDYYSEILGVLKTLKELHPKQNMGKHISTVIDGSDLWGLTDKDLYHALTRYAKQVQFDPHIDDSIDDIIKGGMNLDSFSLLEDPEEY